MGKNFIGVFPSAAAAGGGQLELLDSHTAAGIESSYTYTPSTPILLSNYSAIYIYATVQCNGAFNLELLVNGLTTNYYADGLRVNSSTVTGLADANLGHWVVASTSLLSTANRTVWVIIELTAMDPSLANDGIHGFSKAYNDNLSLEMKGLFHNDNNIGDIDAIKFEASANQWVAGSSFYIYGVKST